MISIPDQAKSYKKNYYVIKIIRNTYYLVIQTTD